MLRAPALLFLAHLLVAAAPVPVADTMVPRWPAPLNPFQTRFLDNFLAGTIDPSDLGNGGGSTAQLLAYVGREDLVMRKPFSHLRRNCQPLLKDGAAVDPVAFIAERAAEFRVTMLNEAHDVPQGRAFNLAVASALKPKGYNYYGAETFSYSIGRNGPPWPLLADGYYASEPVYGTLIRALRRMAYHLFPYETQSRPDISLSPNEQINKREADQAANLTARLKDVPEESRILLHVGYGHLNKTGIPGAPKMMAARFREMTGINPLTVDQTMFWSKTGQYVVCDLTAFQISDPSEIYIGAPIPTFTRERPDWRLSSGDHFVEIPQQLKRPTEDAIYEVKLIKEPDNAVPLDRLLVRAGETIPLVLPDGEFRVAVWTKASGWSSAVAVSVVTAQ